MGPGKSTRCSCICRGTHVNDLDSSPRGVAEFFPECTTPQTFAHVLLGTKLGDSLSVTVYDRCTALAIQINPHRKQLRPEKLHCGRIAARAAHLSSQPIFRTRGSSSARICAVPVCQRERNPSRNFNRTRGFASILRTYPAFLPCSATIQNCPPTCPLPTGVRRVLPLLRPTVSSSAYPRAAKPNCEKKLERWIKNVLLQEVNDTTFHKCPPYV